MTDNFMIDFSYGNSAENKVIENPDCQSELFIIGLHHEINEARNSMFDFDKSIGINRNTLYTYTGEEKVICPEPLTFIHEYDDIIGQTQKINLRFKENISKFTKIYLGNIPKYAYRNYSENIWENTTIDSVNLRPGYVNGDTSKYGCIQLNDAQVHGLIAGQTGSGKSVFVNQLILNLITEYAPWELDLYLADFKKVELSRYMTNPLGTEKSFTPHIKACAATSQLQYVISLFRNLVDKMNARNDFFTMLGITKLSEFRERYNLVLPRVVLLVDEFQQMFAGASSKEQAEIVNLLNLITKLGRSTGFHLLFASQEMSGALPGNTLANFKVRMALKCSDEVSRSTIGNNAASKIERGNVIINTGSGQEYENIMFKIPYFKGEDKENNPAALSSDEKFFNLLAKVKEQGNRYYDSILYKLNTQKFYNEDEQQSQQEYLDDLVRIEADKIKKVQSDNNLFDAVLLGKTTLYSEKSVDSESFLVESGINKGVLIASPESDDIARIRKLIFENIKNTSENTVHCEISLNKTVEALFKLDNAISENGKGKYINLDVTEAHKVYGVLYTRQFIDNHLNEINSIMNGVYALGARYNDAVILREKTDYLDRLNDINIQINNKSSDRAELEKVTAYIKRVNPLTEFILRANGRVGVSTDKSDTRLFAISEISYWEEIEQLLNNNPLQSGSKILHRISEILSEITERRSSLSIDNQTAEMLIYEELQMRMLIMLISFYSKRRKNEEVSPANKKLTQESYIELETIYTDLEYKVRDFLRLENAGEISEEKATQAKAAMKKISSLNSEIIDLELEKKELESRIPELLKAEEYLLQQINNLVKQCYNYVYGVLKIKDIAYPVIQMIYENNSIVISKEKTDDMCDDLFKLLNGKEVNTRTVVWINGLDELSNIPNYLTEFIKYSLKYNILVVANISSKINDFFIKKAFDYVFVTGNNSGLYDDYNIQYTNPPIGSIIVSFKIISKNIFKAFKMYRSELDKVTDNNFMDELLQNN